MKYRDAKLKKVGDWITRKSDKLVLKIDSMEIFGQYKKVKFRCILPTEAGGSFYCDGLTYVSLFNEEVV